MSWHDENWFSDGIVNEVYVEQLDPWNTHISRGRLEGFIDGALTFGYFTHLKVSGSLNISDANYIPGSVLRIHHIATLGSEQYKGVLATCIVSGEDLTYLYGKYSGSLELSSMLLKFDGDIMYYDGGVSSGRNALEFFEYQVTSQGCECFIHPGLVEKPLTSLVWAFGMQTRQRLEDCASAVGGQIGTDEMGRITLNPFVLPAYKSPSFLIPKGQKSITFLGIPIDRNRYSSPNRACVKYQNGNTVLYGLADLDPTHPRSRNRIGYINAISETISQLNPVTQEAVNARAQLNLALASNNATRYEAQMYYYKMNAVEGQVGTFQYQDSLADPGINSVVMAEQIDLTLDYRLSQKVILLEVRTN